MVCGLAKIISSLYREWVGNFEIRALSRVQDQCEKEQWEYIISLDCITSDSIKWTDGEKHKPENWVTSWYPLLRWRRARLLPCFLSCLHHHPNSWFSFLLSLLKWVFSHPVVIQGLCCLVLQNGEDLTSSGFCPPLLVSSPFNKPGGCTVAEAFDRTTSKFPFPIGLAWLPLQSLLKVQRV